MKKGLLFLTAMAFSGFMLSNLSVKSGRAEPLQGFQRIQSNPNSTLNNKIFTPIVISRIPQLTCDQRWEKNKNEVWSRQWASRKDLRDFLELAYVDCPRGPVIIASEACKNESETIVTNLTSLGWDYFSKVCELKNDPEGNPEKDILNCEKYIDSFNATKAAGLSEIQDIADVASREVQETKLANDPAFIQATNAMKPYQTACYCGNGTIDGEWEDCDPADKTGSAYCNSQCKILKLQKSVDSYKKIAPVQLQQIDFFPQVPAK